MDAMSGIIAENLKRIRKENKWSLDTVSDMTGVSKSMLGQIERGESSPTISTLWKIATGLHISFTGLLEQSEKEAEIISKEEVNPLLSDGGHFRLYPFFPYHHERKFEMLHIELDPGSRSVSEAHEPAADSLPLALSTSSSPFAFSKMNPCGKKKKSASMTREIFSFKSRFTACIVCFHWFCFMWQPFGLLCGNQNF